MPLGDGRTQSESFESSWRTERESGDGECQTDAIEYVESGSAMAGQAEVACQTVDALSDKTKMKNDSSEAFKTFLRGAAPAMEEQLERNLQSHAFDGWDVSWEDGSESVSCLASLSYKFEDVNENGETVEVTIPATSVSWNANGSVLAVSYGRLDHESWCTHRGMVCCWYVFRRGMNPQKPDVVFETPNCAMYCAFHPEHPSILAGGTFNGEVYLWNVAETEGEPLLCSSPISETSHREPISKLVWLQLASKKGYQIISLGLDGKILVWAKNNRLKEPLNGFKLVANQRHARRSNAVIRQGVETVLGGTCMSFTREALSTVIVGTEGGDVYKCTLSEKTAKVAAKDDKDKKILTFPSPIDFAFEPFAGPVESVACSPYHRNLVLACSTDSTVRMYNVLQTGSIKSWLPSGAYCFDVAWAPARPAVFAVASADGVCYVYDLVQDSFAPSYKLEFGKREPLISLAFSPRSDHLATGDQTGVVRVWQLNTALTEVQSSEQAILDGLGRARDDDEGLQVDL